MKMSICKKCLCIWAVPDLTLCDECQGTEFTRVERPTSIEDIFEGYRQRRDLALLPKHGVATSTDLYPLILEDLVVALDEAGVEFVLYGSAGLWLEGTPRPDKGDFQTVKDLDMCVWAEGGVQTMKARLMAVIAKNTIVGTFIRWDDVRYVHLSTAYTLEIKSIDHLVQFSFSLKENKSDYTAIAKLAAGVSLPTKNHKRIRCAGLSYISAGLLSETGLFRTTLFRSDKTEKILIYACMCVGYETRTAAEVVMCLTVHLAGAGRSDKKAQLTNVRVDRNTKRKTKYFEQTKDMMNKLETINKFENDLTTYNPIIESSLDEILKFIKTSKLSRKDREELANKRLAIRLKQLGYGETKKPAQKELKLLMLQIQQGIAAEVKNELLETVLQITVEDALDIWGSEVGTAMLIFLTEQLEPAYRTICNCTWITEPHRKKLLTGHANLLQRLLEELDDRLEKAGNHSVKPPKGPQVPQVPQIPQVPRVPRVQAPMLVGVGKRVRIGYHLHYDVVGRVTASTPQLLTIRIENCYVPGTTTTFDSEHSRMVLSHQGGVMSWLWEPDLIDRIED